MPKRHPGIYVEEISALKSIEEVSTTTTAFIGFAPAGKVGMPVEVDSWQAFCSEFTHGRGGARSLPVHMPDAVRGYFENGGKKAIILRLDEAYAAPDQYVQGVAKLGSVSDLGMVVTPETQDEHVVELVLSSVTERRQAVYLFDAPPGMEPTELRGFAGRFDSDYGALYYPWLQIGGRAVPSAGHVAGVIVRTDLKRGVYKAPAGTGAAILGITGTSITVTANELDRLREARVNWIGSSRRSPIALQGARTLGESYLSVRRALIYLERSLTCASWTMYRHSRQHRPDHPRHLDEARGPCCPEFKHAQPHLQLCSPGKLPISVHALRPGDLIFTGTPSGQQSYTRVLWEAASV